MVSSRAKQVQVDPATGAINFVQTSFQNAGRQNARGADMSGQWQLQTAWGTWTVLSQWAYLDQFIFQATTESIGRNVVAQVSDNLGGDGCYRWKGISRVDWAWHNFDLNATWHYTGGFREIIFNNNANSPTGVHEHWTHPTNFIDVQAGYTPDLYPASRVSACGWLLQGRQGSHDRQRWQSD